MDFVQFLFTSDAKHCGHIPLEIAELQADNEARIQFDVYKNIAKVWVKLPNRHLVVRNIALQVRGTV